MSLLLVLWLSASGIAFAQNKKNQATPALIQATPPPAKPESPKVQEMQSNGSLMILLVDDTQANVSAFASLQKIPALRVKTVANGIYGITAIDDKDILNRMKAAYPELIFLTPAQFEHTARLLQKEQHLVKMDWMAKMVE